MSHVDFRPLALLAELTHRCPLRCPYCSNPLTLISPASELSTDEWLRVLREAAELGVLHVFFSGGEPLLRDDLDALCAGARALGLYSNLITSGLGLDRARAEQLAGAGLDSVQVSFQADEAQAADGIAGGRAHARKLAAAREVVAAKLPLTVNVVLHRGNIDRVAAMVSLAEALGAERLELAHTQFYGWANHNAHALLPTRDQVDAASTAAAEAQRRLRGRMDVLYVRPDYFGERPKACMGGWGRRYLTVDPSGRGLPCATATEIPGLTFANVREHPLAWIWERSEAFNRFRGADWLPDPCRTCPEREVDFGGCRCQAALILGDAGLTDPACALSPGRDRLLERVAASAEAPLLQLRKRTNPR